jgi:parallel beta-helix repeat protein
MNQARDRNGGWPAGISLEAVRNVTLTANGVSRNYGEGIGLVSAEQVTVEGNTVLNNYSVGIYCDNCAWSKIKGNFVGSDDVRYYRNEQPSVCIAVANESATSVKLNDVTISNGVYVNCRHAFEYGKWEEVVNGTSRSIIGGGMRNFKFVNNTAYRSTGPMLKIDKDDGQSAKMSETSVFASNLFANNVFYQSGSAPLSAITATQRAGFTFHNNAWFGGTSGAAAGSGDLNADPQLVRPGTMDPRDYRLRSDSRAATAGAALDSVSHDYDSIPRTSPYSIGAFEMANRVSNAEFESGVLFPWRAYGSASVSSSGARSGRHAAVITTVSGAEGGFEQSISGLKPNTTYTARAWLRVNTAGEAVFLGQKQAGTGETSVRVTSTSWTAVKLRFQTGPSSTSAIIYMYKPSGSSPAFGDDFELLEGAH